jgi:hypothetical protein
MSEHTELAQPYWGVQKLTSFPEKILEEISSGRRYVDLTAGGGGMVFERSKFQAVHGNDRNPYAAAGFQVAGMIQNLRWTSLELGKRIAETAPSTIPWARHGYLSSTYDSEVDRFFPPMLASEVREYVDSLCKYDTIAAYFVTRVLMDELTVRCRAWDKSSPVASSPELLYQKVTEITERWFKLLATRNAITGTNESAENAYRFVRPGDVVYTDPAWPWDPSLVIPNISTGGFDADNPYDFLTCAAGSILRQEHIRPDGIPFWLAKNGPEHIWDDVASWVRSALSGGAKSFILSTQGTNWPAPDLTIHEVAERSGTKVDHYEYTVATTRRSDTKFTEWFAILREGK